MKRNLQEKCYLQADNTLCIRKNFKWDYSWLHTVTATALMLNGAVANETEMKRLASTIKKKAGLFSDLNNYLRLPAIAKMYVSDNPEKYINNVLGVYDSIPGNRLASLSRMTAAMILSEYAEGDRLMQLANRTSEIFELMKKEHSVLTDSSLIPSAAFLAVSTSDSEGAVQRVEEGFNLLVDYFGKKRTTYRLAALVSLSEGILESICAQVIEIHKTLKLCGHAIGKGSEMIPIGALAGHGSDSRSIAEAIIEVETFLADQKGYSNFALGEKSRLSLACLTVLSQCEEDFSMSVSVLEENRTERSLMLNAGLYVCIYNSAENAATTTAATCC